MSDYNDPKPEHRNALAQINDARQRGLAAVSELRKREISTPYPHLAPANTEGQTPSLPVLATQAVVDYLLQLRPYRDTSKKWDVDFGVVNLPEKIDRGSAPGRGRGEQSPLYISSDPKVPLNNVSQLIEALNRTIIYSTSHRDDPVRAGVETKSFKFVFGPQELLQVVELADEVAAEMDLLIELDDPDYSSSGGDAA
jgi:hypothetical protein